jgi:hypothetical protein
MPYVSFIKDDDFKKIIFEILDIAADAKKKSDTKFNDNVIDPFSVLIEIGGFDIDFDTWIISEKTRQAQKTLSNHVGLLHQKLLGCVNGWTDLGVGQLIDVVNTQRKIIAEIKNKHNTIKGSDKIGLYKELENLVMMKGHQYKDFTAYYVEIVPKKADRYNICFTPSDKSKGSKCAPNDKVRQIDGASFYSLVTGIDNALEQIFQVLPNVIKDCKVEAKMTGAEKASEFFKSAYVPKPAKISRRKNLKALQ